MTFILLLFVGPIVSLLVGQLLTKSLFLRGFVAWGFIAGLLVLLSIFEAGNLVYQWNFKSVFSELGPCGLCYEWSGFPLFFWWVSWGVGSVIYLIASAVALRSVPRNRSFTLIRWPKNLWRWGIGCLIGVASIAIGIEIPNSIAHADLVRQIHDVQTPIITGQVLELGAIPVTNFRLTAALSNAYVETAGIQFSADQQWLTLAYENKLELWRMADLQVVHTWNADSVFWQGNSTFSSDGSLLAVWISGNITVYSTRSEALEPVWESHDAAHQITHMAFSADNHELIVEEFRSISRLESLTGNALSTTGISLTQSDRPQFALSRDGEYLATNQSQSILVYESGSGRLIHQFDSSSRPNPGLGLFGQFAFLPNNNLLFWSYQPTTDSPNQVWDLTTSTATPVTVSIRLNYNPQVSISPDSRFAIFASQQNSVIWDFAARTMVGSIPVKSAITALAFTPDQKLLAVATADGYLRFFASTMPDQ